MSRLQTSKYVETSLRTEVLMVDRKQASAIAAVSVATWDRMNAAGKTPQPIHLSKGCVRWRLDDLRLWVAHGCPNRATFSTLKHDENS